MKERKDGKLLRQLRELRLLRWWQRKRRKMRMRVSQWEIQRCRMKRQMVKEMVMVRGGEKMEMTMMGRMDGVMMKMVVVGMTMEMMRMSWMMLSSKPLKKPARRKKSSR